MSVTVVAGPPCSGKSTYIREHAASGDVLIDWDALAQALGYPADHGASDWAGVNVVHAARTAALAAVLDDRTLNAWVIHSSPTAAQVALYQSAGATIVCLDPGKPVCQERAAAEGRPASTYATIGRWYGMTQPALAYADH